MSLNQVKTALATTAPGTTLNVQFPGTSYPVMALELMDALGIQQPKLIVSGEQGANLRKGAGITYPILTLVQRGKTVDRLDKPTVRDPNYTWIPVKYNGQEGYIAGHLLSPVPVATNRSHKVGAHICQGGQPANYIQLFRDAKAMGKPFASATVINQPEIANALVDLVDGPVIYRDDPDGEDKPVWNMFTDFYVAGANWVRSRMVKYASLDKRVFLQFTNEPGYDPHDVDFWRGVMDACEAAGYRAAIFADQVGNPKDDDFIDKWKKRIPALIQCKAKGHIVLYHAYAKKGTPAGELTPGEEIMFYELRPITVWKELPPEAQANVVISEFASEYDTGAFQGIAEGIHAMDAMNARVMSVPFILAFNLWTFGVWKQSSIDSMMEAIKNWIRGRL